MIDRPLATTLPLLSGADLEACERLLAAAEAKSGMRNSSVEAVVQSWQRAIRSLLPDYKSSVWNYICILEDRSLLQQIREQLTSSGEENLISVLKPIDEQFLRVTTPIQAPIRGNHSTHDWWRYRIPSTFLESGTLQLFPALTFTPEDEATLVVSVKGLSQIPYVFTPPQRVEALLSAWVRTTIEVKHGYRLSIDSYINDLSTRDILDEIYARLSDKGKNELSLVLEPADELFNLATVSITSDSNLLMASQEPKRWWWYRIPRNLLARLKQDFATWGISSDNSNPLLVL